jgi:hypothetical protein
MLNKIIKSKNNLLEEGLAKISIRSWLMLIELPGKIQTLAIDVILEVDLFSDFFFIFRSLLQSCTSSSNGKTLLYQKFQRQLLED